MKLSEEVFAVILALSIVSSTVGVAMVVPRNPEAFAALGLLDEYGRIGEYPREVYVGRPFKLAVFIANYMGSTRLFMVRAKLGYGEIPTESSPLDRPALLERFAILCHSCNTTLPVILTLSEPFRNQTIVFELYTFNTGEGRWDYTGRYTFLRVDVSEVVVVG